MENIVDILTNHDKYKKNWEKSSLIKCTTCYLLPVPELSTKDSCCPHSSVSFGPYCDTISFNINTIKENETSCRPSYFKFTNGSTFEIGRYHRDRFTWDDFTTLISNFTGETKV